MAAMNAFHFLICLSVFGSLLAANKVSATEPESANSTWPFTRLVSPTIPTVQDTAWVRNPIDAFVLSKLEGQGIKSAPEVPPRVWLRRLYFDMVGLPPTPEDVDRFVTNWDSGSYSREIDRLLQDPRYGER